jgi:hypothetical protein
MTLSCGSPNPVAISFNEATAIAVIGGQDGWTRWVADLSKAEYMAGQGSLMVLADGCIAAPPHTGPSGRSGHSHRNAAEVEHVPSALHLLTGRF